MAKGTRAKARAEKERLSALTAAKRARVSARQMRRRALWKRSTGWIPPSLLARLRGHNRQGGALAVRRRKQRSATVGMLLVLNVVVWVIVPEWSGRAMAAVASVLVAPVLYTMLFRRD